MSERILYREGQLLASADLRDEAERDDRLRAMHVRYQHGTWGIAAGLGVSLSSDSRSVAVAPGYALDAEGRDLLVPSERRLAAPLAPDPQRLALVALHERGRRRRHVASPCGGEQTGRLPERAVLAWQPPQVVASGTVVLAVARVEGGVIDPPLERGGRRYARRMTRPRVATGSTEGRSPWSEWKESGQGALGLQLEVDTSEARFRTTPLYLVSLAGPASGGGLPGAGTAWPFKAGSVLDSGHLGFVASAQDDRFIFRLAGGDPPFGFPLDADAASEGGWHVRWLAVETAGGQP
jgi:hypothetical protein